MARVVAISRGNQAVKPHPSKVTMFVQRLTDRNGEILFHVATMGSNERRSHPKTSQTLQLDRAAAEALIDELIAAFGSSVLPPAHR